jgi:hypothetical protein
MAVQADGVPRPRVTWRRPDGLIHVQGIRERPFQPCWPQLIFDLRRKLGLFINKVLHFRDFPLFGSFARDTFMIMCSANSTVSEFEIDWSAIFLEIIAQTLTKICFIAYFHIVLHVYLYLVVSWTRILQMVSSKSLSWPRWC